MKWNPVFFFFFNCGWSSRSSRAEETVKYFAVLAAPQRFPLQNPFPALSDYMRARVCACVRARVWQRTPSARSLLRSAPEGAFSSNPFTPSQPAPDIKEKLGRRRRPPNRILLHHYCLCFFPDAYWVAEMCTLANCVCQWSGFLGKNGWNIYIYILYVY